MILVSEKYGHAHHLYIFQYLQTLPLNIIGQVFFVSRPRTRHWRSAYYIILHQTTTQYQQQAATGQIGDRPYRWQLNRWHIKSVTSQFGDNITRWQVISVTEFNSNVIKCSHRPIVYDSSAVAGTCPWRLITAIGRETTHASVYKLAYQTSRLL